MSQCYLCKDFRYTVINLILFLNFTWLVTVSGRRKEPIYGYVPNEKKIGSKGSGWSFDL